MRRPFVLCLALGALATAFWLAPGPRPPAPREPVLPPVAETKFRPPAPALPPPPAGTVFNLGSGPSAPSFAVALDELYLPQGPTAARLVSIPTQPGLGPLLAYAAAFPAPAPRLVLYPAGGPRNAATRRILNPALEVALASPGALTPAPRPELGIVAWERPAYAPARALARIAGDPAQPLRAAAALAGSPGVVFARPLLARQWSRKAIPNDPLFKDQWHLRNTGQQGGIAGLDIRAVPAWDGGTGTGIVVGIVDDGLDYRHPDLAPGHDAALGHDWNGGDEDPAPGVGERGDDDHGTAVAGLVAARGGNSLGVAGVAPSATLAGLRLISAPTDDSEDAGAMAWRNDAILVKNNSWGPPDASYDYPADLYPPGALWSAAVADAVRHHGTIFVFAAGNGQADGDQGSKDGYACFRDVIAVGAVDNRGAIASFSEGGPHLVVAAPGDASVGLVTTDRSGDKGYNTSIARYPGDYPAETDYTKAFAGTSAAAPVVSGVVALLLEARPELGLRDLKEIFLRSSTRLQPSSIDWVTRPAGDAAHPIKHHPRLGGGLVNAQEALALARAWTPLGGEFTLTSGLLSPEAAIPDAGLAFVLTPPAFFSPDNPIVPDPTVLRVEHVELTLDVTHPYRGDLEIKLISPAGTVSLFAAPTRADFGNDYKGADGAGGYTFSSVRHWGETSVGSAGWRISVRDSFRKDSGVLHNARLTLHGTRIVPPVRVADPAPQALATGSTLVLTAAFSGANLEYQWTRDGEPIAGADGPVYRLDNYTAKAAGDYVCVATNAAGSASTAAAAVTADDTPRATHTLRIAATTDLALGDTSASVAWSASGLPAGLTLDHATGHLLGRPRKSGTTAAIVTATSADGIVTRIPLRFVVDPLPAAIVATYVGLVGLDEAQLSGPHGLLSVTLSAKGSYTGTWTFGGRTNPVKGLIDRLDETALELPITVPPRSTEGALVAPGQTIRLRLPLDGSPARGRAANVFLPPVPVLPLPTADDPIVLRRARFSSKNPATAYSGRYTFAATDVSESSPLLGHAAATLEVSAAGRVKWFVHPPGQARKLAGSVLLADDGLLPLFVRTTDKTGTPLLEGWLTLGNTLTDSLLLYSSRPAALLGGRYARPATGERLLGVPAGSPGLAVTLECPAIDDGEPLTLAEPTLTATAAQGIAIAAPNAPRFSTTANPATGLVTGRFALFDPDPRDPARTLVRVVNYSAVVLPSEALILGTYLVPALPGGAAASGSIRFSPASSP